MKKNMGSVDRSARIITAVILASLYYNDTITGTTGVVLLVVAAVFFLTSLTGFCPIYKLFGFNTCQRQ